jgi:4-hydroxy-tetrahydrodipicolinate synthase
VSLTSTGPLTRAGIYAALVLPFTADDRPDLATFERYVDAVVVAGVAGVVINADSGEGMSLWPQERRDILQLAARVVDSRVTVISGLIAGFTGQATRLAEEAAADGADALLVFPNVHLRGRPLPSEVPLRYLDAIHTAAGLPIVAFQLQDALGGVEYEPETLRAIVELPYVPAIKESSFDPLKFRTTLDLVRQWAPDVLVLSGNDNFIYESFLLGADGSLMGAGSLATAEQVRMFEAVRRGDLMEAAELDARSLPLMRAVFGPPVRDYRARTKEALVAQGVFANATVREPLLPIGDAERAAIVAALAQADLKETR